eukprot:4242099-Alexandrium_andersonii.AAC.1
MSASLVGSEMCIRDRMHEQTLLSSVRSQRERVNNTCFRQLRASDKTVSYTHLTLPTICSV